MRSRLRHPRHADHRSTLRVFGILLTAAGAVFTGIGLLSLFGAFRGDPLAGFGANRGPDLFWCAFVGLPLLGAGMNLLRLGYLGAITRYTAGETVPVATDALGHVAEHGRDALRGIGGALRGERQEGAGDRACISCGAAASANARFCQQCGNELAHVATGIQCKRCRHDNAPGSRFCAGCGDPLHA